LLSASNSLIIRENTGNIRNFSAVVSKSGQKNVVLVGVFVEIPCARDQGILKRYQGISLLHQGIYFEQQGNLIESIVKEMNQLLQGLRYTTGSPAPPLYALHAAALDTQFLAREARGQI